MMRRTYKPTAPLALLGLMNLLGFALLALQQQEMYDRIKMVVVGVLFFSLMMVCYCLIHIRHMGDPFLFLPVMALLSFGLLMLMRIGGGYGEKQMLWLILSAAVYFLAYTFYRRIRFWDRLLPLYALLSIGLFLATLLFGRSIYGAKNWIYIGNQGFQPSELIRLLYVLALSAMMSAPQGSVFYKTEHRRDMVIMGYVYLHLGFLVLQREWGIAVLFFLIYIAMHFVFRKNPSLVVLNVALAALSGLAGYRMLYHIQTRVAMWLDPFSDPSGRGYQIVQSLIAMASGGFMGTGLGMGHPDYIPFVESDFIFSSICEEFGLLGGIGVILLFFLLVYRGFKLALAVGDAFDKAVALGLTVMLAFQTFIILGGVIKLIPLTGITLPFISYGGSSLLTNFMALGILQAISLKEGDSLE